MLKTAHSHPTHIIIPSLTMPRLLIQRDAYAAELVSLYSGDVTVFSWVEHLRHALSSAAADLAGGSADLLYVDSLDLDSHLPVCGTGHSTDIRQSNLCDMMSEVVVASTSGGFQPSWCDNVRGDHDAPHMVEVTTGSPFYPPKSGPGETMQAHVASVNTMEQVP